MDPGLLNCLNGPGEPLVDLLAVKTPGPILGSGKNIREVIGRCTKVAADDTVRLHKTVDSTPRCRNCSARIYKFER